MEGLDRSLVTVGYPVEDGLFWLWSDSHGWPVVAVAYVEVTHGIVTWWCGTGGTNRPGEIPELFRFDEDKYLGSSRITPAAVAHYDVLWKRTSAKVQVLLDARKVIDS